MDQESFTTLEVENLQKLIEGNAVDELIGDDQQIKDEDILFFSQYGHLEGAQGEATLEVQQTFQDNHYGIHPLKEGLTMVETLQQANGGFQPIGNNQAMPITHLPKYKVLDGKSTRVFECGICGKEFGHQYTLLRHLPTHTDERKFHCLTCGKSFRQMSTLSQHKAIHSTARPYVCQICNKNFNRVSTLISHSKTHTGVKPHRCHLCNKAFHQKGNLRNHIFTHTNERPYKCDICNKGFNQMSNLMCHKMKTHKREGESNYMCVLCGENFDKPINLRQHKQFKHGINPPITLPMEITPPRGAPIKDYSSAIIVDPINTDAMKLALSSGETPFALLRPLSGIPVLVRVIPAGDKQMLVPATAEDLKKYGHISIKAKVDETQAKTKGCVVQIKVPVVATVIQKCNAGNFSMNVVSPEGSSNGGEFNADSFVYTSTVGVGDDVTVDFPTETENMDSFMLNHKYDAILDSLNYTDVNLMNQQSDDLMNKTLDINAMEFSFEVPQDAREMPPSVGPDFVPIDAHDVPS